MREWNTDAQFATELNRKFISTTPEIETYLNSYTKFILVASKGMGKTLLMRIKREIIKREEPGILLIPQNETSDYVTLPASPEKHLFKSFHDASFWEDIWKLSISISALLNFPHNLSDVEIDSINDELSRAELPSSLFADLMSAFKAKYRIYRFPSGVLDILLQSGKSFIENARSTVLQIVHGLFVKYISSACFIFIDSFDQALSKLFPDNLKIWCAAQNGLLRAAWELTRHNRHVKVYIAIRQEAYSSFANTERSNIRGSVLLIQYSKNDLENIFLKAIKQYENLDTIQDFVGLDKVYNGYLRLHENIFDYIYRHTIGVPRWLITIGSEISNSRKSRGRVTDNKEKKMLQKKIADIVNRVSATDLAYEYLRSEMRLFFQDDDPECFIDNLISKINSTVLSLSNVKRIAEHFASDPNWSGTKHPFCLLFNLGLFGYVADNASSTGKRQIFKRPYEFDWNYENILPVDPSTYYLIHPSLHHLIQKKNYRFNFNKVKIGNGLSWTKKNDKRMQQEKIKIFISYSHADWQYVDKIIETIEEYLNRKSILHDIWLDRWKMRSGKWMQDQILVGLEDSDFLIFIISMNSLGSNAVAVEWKTKFAKKISKGEDSIFPFLIDDTPYEDLPEFLKQIYSYRYENDRDKIIKLVEDILFWKAEQVA